MSDCLDNCPAIANMGQADFDGDGLGDVCETGVALADANNSGRVDGFDLGMLGIAFASRCGEARYEPRVDLDRNCRIEGDDLAIMAAAWAKSVAGP